MGYILGFALNVMLITLFCNLVMMIRILFQPNLPRFKPYEAIADGLLQTTSLCVVLSFIPTILVLVFDKFFTIRSGAEMQREIYHWYRFFEVAFIVFATAIGTLTSDWVIQAQNGNLSQWFMKTLVHRAHQDVHTLLAKALPQSTNWYTQFLVSQCAIQFMDLTRYISLVKYLAYRTIYDSEMARVLSEPEDQDYYGIGSRSARWLTNMWIGIMCCQLSPLTSFFVFANFVVCRLVYGYLLLYAETRKPDMGGLLWVQMLRDLQICLFVYIVLMIGYFELNHDGKSCWWPSVIVSLSLIPWGRSFYEFSNLSWKYLPYEELATHNSEKMVTPALEEPYIQPELVNADEEYSAVMQRATCQSSSSDLSSDDEDRRCRC